MYRFPSLNHKTINTRCRFQFLRTYRMKARIRRKEIRFKSQNNKYTVSISTFANVSNESANSTKGNKVYVAKQTVHGVDFNRNLGRLERERRFQKRLKNYRTGGNLRKHE